MCCRAAPDHKYCTGHKDTFKPYLSKIFDIATFMASWSRKKWGENGASSNECGIISIWLAPFRNIHGVIKKEMQVRQHANITFESLAMLTVKGESCKTRMIAYWLTHSVALQSPQHKYHTAS